MTDGRCGRVIGHSRNHSENCCQQHDENQSACVATMRALSELYVQKPPVLVLLLVIIRLSGCDHWPSQPQPHSMLLTGAPELLACLKCVSSLDSMPL